jgi:hypothetical protein
VGGETAIACGEQRTIPILLSLADTDGNKITAEKQIARHAKARCAVLNIPAGNTFFDAGMYATLAVEMARAMGAEVNAVNFGGPATERAVSKDLFATEDDGERRLKTWNEHVSKFVTELWFAVRLVAQCRQMRNFPRAAAEEFGKRIWKYVSRDRYELESKDDYKLRCGGESPNHADSLAIAVEGARRLGFQITALSERNTVAKKPDWLDDLSGDYQTFMKERHLIYA